MGWTGTEPKKDVTPGNKRDINEVLKKYIKSVITPDFEKLKVIPPMEMSKKKLKELRKVWILFLVKEIGRYFFFAERT